MGRGNRGGGGGGRGGRGGRRGSGGSSGGGGGGRHHQGGRPGQPAATAPAGEALLVELRAAPEFHEAIKARECPAKSHGASAGATPLGTSELEMADWRDLGALIGWFRDGLAADPLAELAFSPKLTKALRASVHGTATVVGLGGLGTSSRGLGETRRVVVLSKERAERALPALDEKQDHKTFWVWRWAAQQGLQASRDEVAEMVVNDVLTPELQAIWERQSAQQRAVQQLCAAAATGDVTGAEAALAAQPGLLVDRVFDVQTGLAPLHMAAREGQVTVLELLLAKGADVDAKDGHGWTPLQVARKFEQSDAEGVLLRAGAHDPDKKMSLLGHPSCLPNDKPAARSSAPAAVASAALPTSTVPASEGVLDLDSIVSVCGTERDNPAADVSSNADDYADPQYQVGSTVFELVEEEAAPAGEGHTAAAADTMRAQAEAVALAATAAAEAEAAAEEAAAEEEVAAEEAAETAEAVAIQAFEVAIAAAEAAEVAAEEAESLGGSEGAKWAAAFRKESEAAVAAAAVAAVAVGEAIDDVMESMKSGGSMTLASPPVELASNASVCSSDMAHINHSLEGSGEFGGAGSSAMSGASSAAVPHTPAPSVAGEEEQALAEATQAAVGAAAAALAASSTAAAVAGGPGSGDGESGSGCRGCAAAGLTVEGQPVQEAAEQAAAAAKGAAAAVSKAASAARAELEARLPEWGMWVQEHPGSMMAGASVTAAAIAALLLFIRWRGA